MRGDTMPAFRLVRRFSLRREGDPLRFDLHGRLYGAFWMNLKAIEREHLRIDGEPIADLDFSGMFPNLAYRHVGRRPPEGDLYDIPGLEGHRDGAKAALSAPLSYAARCRACRQNSRRSYPRAGPRADSKPHPDLVPLFGKDLGLDLMFTESRILMATLQRLMAEGIPALPMHDGLMVPRSKAEAARRALEDSAQAVIGSKLPVSRKP